MPKERNFPLLVADQQQRVKMSKERNYNRRQFLNNAFMSVGAAELSMMGLGKAHFTDENKKEVMKTTYETRTSFDPLKQVDAGLLNVGYAEAGPPDGTPVILLHGWPYDIYSYADVAPLLASAGWHDALSF